MQEILKGLKPLRVSVSSANVRIARNQCRGPISSVSQACGDRRFVGSDAQDVSPQTERISRRQDGGKGKVRGHPCDDRMGNNHTLLRQRVKEWRDWLRISVESEVIRTEAINRD
jgi:hypothetical protein